MEVILEFLRHFYLVFLLTIQKNYLFKYIPQLIDYILSTKRSDVPLNQLLICFKHFCIENMAFKFYNLIVSLFTKFLPYYMIGLGI